MKVSLRSQFFFLVVPLVIALLALVVVALAPKFAVREDILHLKHQLAHTLVIQAFAGSFMEQTLDLVLPDMDGCAVVEALLESASLERIPLLVYSALDVGSADQSRLRLGPTQFLTKSRCGLAEFEGQVVRLLGTITTRTEEEPHAA